MSEHAVIVRFKYGLQSLGQLYELEHNLSEAIASEAVGEYDGHEISANLSGGILYMYGPDADVLLSVVKPILKNSSFMSGASITQRFGDAGDTNAREARTVI
jgi:hypothetical protein